MMLKHWNLIDPNDQRSIGGDFNDYVNLLQETIDLSYGEPEGEFDEE